MTDLLTRPVILMPTGDPTPVEKAAVSGIADMFEPETYLQITFTRPDGGARCWNAWTQGGQPLGDQADQCALVAGMDAADWFAITSRYATEHQRGRIDTLAHPLRPILADIKASRGDDGEFRRKLYALARDYMTETGQPAPDPTRTTRWLGVGPRLVAKP